jgi:hypothetical protein
MMPATPKVTQMETIVHVRSLPDKRFVGTNGNWSEDMTDARVFTSAADAMDYWRLEELKTMELVLIRETEPPLFVPVVLPPVNGL